MKTLIVLIAVVFAFGFSDDKKQVEQKYDVTITITYSAKTLTEAAALEMRTRRVFEDGGLINIRVETPLTFQVPQPYQFHALPLPRYRHLDTPR